MLLSICIPVFNRPLELKELLESILDQKDENLEIILCEDYSPERNKIKITVEEIKTQFNKSNIKYIENNENLGYDKNLRKTIKHASGEYVILSGNDDIFKKNSLKIIRNKIINFSKPDVLIRSFESFNLKSKKNFYQHRYVSKDTIFVLNNKNLSKLYYRSVLVSGLVIKKTEALKHETDKVDGTLYYQNYIIGMISTYGKIIYIPDIIVQCRIIGYADFGSSSTEKKGKWIPGQRTIESSVYQMKMFFKCANILERDSKLYFNKNLKKMSSNYSYTVLSYHRDKGVLKFLKYSMELKKIGYSGLYFYIYIVLLIIFKEKLSNYLINILKRIIGKTPDLY